MNFKTVISSQYRKSVSQASSKLMGLSSPPEGWLCTVRKALGMSAAALGRRLGKTRALISNTEKSELKGGVTLKTMQSLAEGMGCRFVYAIVPNKDVEDILKSRAYEKAQKLVAAGSLHMALEQQSLSQAQIAYEVDRLAAEILRNPTSDFWDDEA